MNKPSWDQYFLSMAFLVSTRSIDPSTKHGTVGVKNNKIIGTGYNGPVSGIDDNKIPLERPDKYPYFIHSELSFLLNATQSVVGSTVYITGHPCDHCLQCLLTSGVNRIVYGPQKSVMSTAEENPLVMDMIRQKNVSFEYLEPDFSYLLNRIGEYIE